ncbi:hypothetical protein HPP92_015723 [Vanilla planifolia]|uniref:Uncharacterized protein n=1 Tax=Vanilla planifolia TaxID=51239 RepID=A0A835QNX1_VANPL|nr:hypothetical protein HPP92_015723 [Vanilla planifolia]
MTPHEYEYAHISCADLCLPTICSHGVLTRSLLQHGPHAHEVSERVEVFSRKKDLKRNPLKKEKRDSSSSEISVLD